MRAFLEGVIAGFGIAIPVGAIGVLLVDLAMRRGFARAAPAALGVASADLLYAALAAVAGVAIASALAPFERPIELVGAAVLIAIAGYRTARVFRPTEAPASSPPSHGSVRIYGGFLALTLVNPMTVVYFAALILGLGEDTLGSGVSRALFVLGAFLASAAWQLLLVAVGAMLHHRLPESARLWTTILGSLVIAALAIRLAFRA